MGRRRIYIKETYKNEHAFTLVVTQVNKIKADQAINNLNL